ncbi:MAG: acyl-CoA dehydrogenase family protein [Chloroflexi bacterium]|nr:acyl-CoA dehydrogenase family protein [Chloroflexota bacterium]
MNTSHGATREEREALLEAARSIAPQIREAADEIEANRQLPRHIVDLLKSIGAFRLLQPRWLGGHDADPVTQILFIAELAKADASTAWCVMIGCDGGLLTRELEPSVAREMYADIDAATCGAGFPPGTARRVEGGYLATGRWPYMSGITHADWVQMNCRLSGDDAASDGLPFIRLVAHRSDVTILDTWTTGGMCGTGSHDVEVSDLFIPDERSVAVRPSNRSVPGDPLRHPAWLLPKHLGVALGLVQAAHDEVMELARERVAFRGALRDDPLTQSTLGETAAQIAACRAYALSASDAAWQEVCETGEMSDANRVNLRLAITHIHQESQNVVERLYAVAGSAALYSERSTLDRRLRDIHAMNQHVVLGASNYAAAARVLLGDQPRAPFW